MTTARDHPPLSFQLFYQLIQLIPLLLSYFTLVIYKLLVLTENKLNKLNTQGCVVLCSLVPQIRDLRSFEIQFKFESAVPIWFNSKVMGQFENCWPCLPVARHSQTTQTINDA